MEPLLHLAIIWLGVFAAVFAARKTKLTPALYFLAVGSILVNLGILPEQSHPFIRGFAEIGMILIMFALGFEESTSKFLKSLRRTWGIALFGALIPFLTAFAVAEYFWGNTNLSLMFGLTMTATALSLTMVSLKSEKLERSQAATGIMTSAVIDGFWARRSSSSASSPWSAPGYCPMSAAPSNGTCPGSREGASRIFYRWVKASMPP
jgi:Kef-type K+ transport system membrane component KefB